MATVPQANHPGRVLYDEVMKPLGISRNRLARDIDVPVGRISAIVSGTRTITADTALRLAKYFGTTPELWLKLQSDYDLAVARATVWLKIDPRVRVLDAAQPLPGFHTATASLEPAPVAIVPVQAQTDPVPEPTAVILASTDAVPAPNEPVPLPTEPVPATTEPPPAPMAVAPIQSAPVPVVTEPAPAEAPSAPTKPDAA